VDGKDLVPPFYGGDNFVGILCPPEWAWVGVGFGKKAVDLGLKFNDRVKHTPCFERSLGQLGEEALDPIHHEADVGVKLKLHRRWRASQALTLGCLRVA